jgi:dihydrofolate synthase/folylpolyglutamate synthase
VEAPRPRIAVVGILADKDAVGILRALDSAVDRFVLTVPDSAPAHRRWDPASALAVLGEPRALAIPDFRRALDEGSRLAGTAGTIVVAGSSHTVGDAMKHGGWIPSEALPGSFESG